VRITAKRDIDAAETEETVHAVFAAIAWPLV
jgi:hypothetical protein